jgi:uncharacterized protein YoxC
MQPVPLAFESIDFLYIILSVFLLLVGVALAYFMVNISGAAKRLADFLGSLEQTLVPLLTRVEGTVSRLNDQLDKADKVTTSAIDAADAADTALRAISIAVTRPVQKVSGLASGVSRGVSTFMSGGSLGEAVDTAKRARVLREEEIVEEIRRTTPPVVSTLPPAPAAPPVDEPVPPQPATPAP